MAIFVGRANNNLLFTHEDKGVVIDAEFGVVVFAGAAEALVSSKTWSAGEFSEKNAELASATLGSNIPTITTTTGRMYTIPKGVQNEAKRSLSWQKSHKRGGTDVGLNTARLLVAGGQISFDKLRHVASYFPRHEADKRPNSWDTLSSGAPSSARISWGLWGGDAAQRWASTIVERENEKALTADGGIAVPIVPADPFMEAYKMGEEVSPEFLARVRMDGTGIDRLYKIDLDGSVFLWDDGAWENLGNVASDIYTLDAELDDPSDSVEKTHIVIDAESAVIISARFAADPFTPVAVEEIEEEEARLVADAIEEVDWEFVDATLLAAGGTPGDGIYTEDERSENASSQVRDGGGKFAKVGGRVMVNGDPTSVGKISQVNSGDGSVSVSLDSGGSITVPGKSVEGIGDFTQTIPGEPVDVPEVDTTGILAEPRTPINRVGAQIPGTLPAMTKEDLHGVLNDWPAWVKSQREGFKPGVSAPGDVPVQKKDSTDLGPDGDRMEKASGQKLTTDAYDHPLIKKWLKKTSANGTTPNSIWYNPITAAAEAVDAGKEMSPKTSDVPPIYLAVVAPDDPRAVLMLVSLVPASSTSTAPMTYVRVDGKWERDPKVLNDLNSATPPPIIPLDSETLNDVLQQVDMTVDSGEAEDSTAPAPAANPVAAPAPAVASALSIPLDHALMVLYGPSEALIAAGRAGHHRGKSAQLRRYWTIGKGGSKIRWGTGGDWTRCVRYLSKFMNVRAKGYCALRHKEMTGQWTGDKRHLQMYGRRSASQVFSTDFIVPSDELVAALTLQGRADYTRARMKGLTASVLTIQQGAAFTIPLLIPEDKETGDGRYFVKGGITLRDLPLPLMWQIKTAEGHDGSYVVGRIDSIERIENGMGNAKGFFDTGMIGREAERMVREGFLRGVSADMDKFDAQQEEVLSETEKDEKGNPAKKDRITVNKARVMGATIVAKPAFQEVLIFLDEQEVPQEDTVIPDGIYFDDADPLDAAALVACGQVASAIPVTPPKDWFINPELSHATPITVDDDGRVFGHIAAWHVDHIGMQFGTKPPRSASGYAYFNTGSLRTEEGSDVTVGQLTLAGGHASLEASAREAAKHYDDTASAIADVHAGEDEHGIWVAGALRPGTTPQQIRVLRASAPSGDWRPIRGKLELVAVCQVNVPGFPVARARVASGHVMALVAAGAATMARLQRDPLAELQDRLDKLEQFSTSELSAQAQSVAARFAEVRAEREAVLATKRAELSARVSAARPPKSDSLTASAAALRARVASAADDLDKRRRETGGTDPKVPAPNQGQPSNIVEAKYTPKTQPRDGAGKFRTVLARLKVDLGTSSNQAVLDKIVEAENLDHAGDYQGAVASAGELISTIDRLDSGALNADSIANVRKATTELGKVIANLPLPFENQAQKMRYSDLPPALRQLVEDLIIRVEDKLDGEEAQAATQELKGFMSGSDVFSQSEVSAQMNRMLRLLT